MIEDIDKISFAYQRCCLFAKLLWPLLTTPISHVAVISDRIEQKLQQTASNSYDIKIKSFY